MLFRHHIHCTLLGLYTLVSGFHGISVAAANPELAAARHAYDDLEFELARAHLDRAVRSGRNTPADMREILRFSGEVAAALDDDTRAEEYFYQMLSLAPGAELPAGSSPKLTGPFRKAQNRVRRTGGLLARCRMDSQGVTVEVHIDADPARMVAGARAVYQLPGRGDRQMVEARSRRRVIVLALPAMAGQSLVCAVIDQHGNHLLEVVSPAAPLVSQFAADTSETLLWSDRRSQSLFAHWATWTTVSVMSTAAGGAFAWRTYKDQRALDQLNEDSEYYDFATAQALARSGRRNALMANLSFAAAGSSALVAVVQFLRRPRAEPFDERASLIGPLIAPDGAGVTWGVSF